MVRCQMRRVIRAGLVTLAIRTRLRARALREVGRSPWVSSAKWTGAKLTPCTNNSSPNRRITLHPEGCGVVELTGVLHHQRPMSGQNCAQVNTRLLRAVNEVDHWLDRGTQKNKLAFRNLLGMRNQQNREQDQTTASWRPRSEAGTGSDPGRAASSAARKRTSIRSWRWRRVR
jgi:hypothetical protein